MKITLFLNELKKRNKLLYYFGWFNIVLLIFAFIMSFADNTTIMGINAWIKPMKFAISITLYVWTFGWIMCFLPKEKKIKTISWLIVVCMLVENLLIFMQAYRGVTSHFNITTPFNAMVFRVMGIFILLNSIIILYILIIFFIKPLNLSGYQRRAWQTGLLLFFLGGISGGIMMAKVVLTQLVMLMEGPGNYLL